MREASFEAIGTAMKVITEKAMLPFIVDVDALKMAKVFFILISLSYLCVCVCAWAGA